MGSLTYLNENIELIYNTRKEGGGRNIGTDEIDIKLGFLCPSKVPHHIFVHFV